MTSIVALLLAGIIPLASVKEESLKDETPVVTPGSGEMFNAIAKTYDTLNRVISLGLDQRWRRAMAEALDTPLASVPSGVVLDVATGTGDVVGAIAQRFPQAHIAGIDPSSEMLAVAREKFKETGARMQWILGSVENLAEFEDGKFDAVTVAFGVRNFQDRAKGLQEMRRVLRSTENARLVVLEVGEPEMKKGSARAFLEMARKVFISGAMPLIGGLLSKGHFSEYRYLDKSLHAFPKPGEFARMLQRAGFVVEEYRQLEPFGLGPYLYICSPSDTGK